MKIKNYLLMVILVLLSNIIYFDYYKSLIMINDFVFINNIMLIVLSIITTYYTITFLVKRLFIKLSILVSIQILLYIYLLFYVNLIPKIVSKDIVSKNDLLYLNTEVTEKWKNTCLINNSYQFKIPFESPKSSNITKEIDKVNSFIFLIDNIDKNEVTEIIYNNFYTNKIIYDKNNNDIIVNNMIEIIKNTPETQILNQINLNDFLNFENIYKYYFSEKYFIPFIDGYLIKTSFQHFLLRNINPDFKNRIEYQRINDYVYVFKIINDNTKEIKYKLLLENNLELETKNLEIIKKVLKTMTEKQCSEQELKELIKYNSKINNFENFAFYFMQMNSNQIEHKEKIDIDFINKYKEIYPKDLLKSSLIEK